MKSITSFIFAIIFTCTAFITVNAQAAETIWVTVNTNAYKTGETVIVTVNSISATPIQGFTFQIRYDSNCLKPVNATTPIPGMNGLSLPQSTGLVDASFASTTPQTVNGVLAEVRFITLSGCQTNLTLESAALAIRNESGFAAPLAGVTVGEKTIALNIDKAQGTSDSQPLSGTPLLLDAETPASSDPAIPSWTISLAATVLGIGGAIVVIIRLFKTKPASSKKH